MEWKNELHEIEKKIGFHEKCNWLDISDQIRKITSNNTNNVQVYIRAIYLLHHILLEEPHTSFEENKLTILLKKIYIHSSNLFSENAEYLFFIGKILYIAEWYFGLNDDLKDIHDRLAFKMQRKAFEKEPNNKLYEWAYKFSLNDKSTNVLAAQILSNEKEKIKWLKSIGFPGEYIIQCLEENRTM